MPDNIIFTILCAVGVAAAAVNMCLELSRDLMMFQQNSYSLSPSPDVALSQHILHRRCDEGYHAVS